MATIGAVALQGGLLALLISLLDWRDLSKEPERAVPVEIVSHVPGSEKPAEKAAANPDAAPPKTDDAGPPSEQPTPPASATPPPPPSVVKPPPEAAPAATQNRKPVEANAAPERTTTPPPPAASPSPAPRTIASREGVFAVPVAAPPDDHPSPEPKPAAPPPPKDDPQAQLQAALPMDTSALPSSFRAVLSGSGTQASEEYKGVVYGRLSRSRDWIEKARAENMRGQVIVALTIDGDGSVADLHVVQSSGDPALDALALSMVRDAAPFPPPPPGALRTFSPVLSFGGD